MYIKERNDAGLSLLEVLIVIGILGIITAVGSGIFKEFVKNTEIDSVKNKIIFDLKQAQGKAMAGDSGLVWGVYFVNSTDDYYQIFSTPTNYASASTTIQESYYLPGQIYFSAPTSTPVEVLFQKIRGTVSGTSTIILVSSSTPTSTIIVAPSGLIY
ncbi:MAG: prepilin-type N-terminal cleavage/methylation domain-containing protein [Patescibacteria group bacterium]